jgi:hypothetical protein
MPEEYPTDPVAYLVEQRFGSGVEAFMGRPALDQEEEGLRKRVEACRAELQGCDPAVLKSRVLEGMQTEAQALKNLEHRAQFFDQPNDTVAYDYWLNLRLWTLEEAIIIGLGKDPRRVKSCHLEGKIDFDDLKRRVLSAEEGGGSPSPYRQKLFLFGQGPL